MHLEELTLRCFLCFREATTVKFNSKFNVIVGPNGSGKSSLLAGMRFVMGESTATDRERYLHHGASSKVYYGYVSAIFDNSDGRIPGLDGTRVTLRRDFGLKKDDFTLNGKKITKQELQSLLESSGFSRTNPYYFVHQHEITALTLMSNSERLQLFKEVAGTRVYDNRRIEASKSLDETRNRRRVIDDTLNVIIDRMNKLKEEQKELREFLDLEKQRRCIEALLTSKELEELAEAIMTLQQSRDRNDARVSDYTTELNVINEEIEKLGAEHQSDEGDLKRLSLQQKELRKTITDLERQVTRLELMIESKKGESERRRKERAVKEVQLKKLKNEALKVEADLKRLGPGKIESENAAREEAIVLRRARQELSQLQNRTNQQQQFTSVAERNKELSKTIKKKEGEIKSLTTLKNDATMQLSELVASLESNPDTSRKLINEFEQCEAGLKLLSERLNQTHHELSGLSDRQSFLLQEDRRLQILYREQDDELYRATKRLNHTMRADQQTANEAAYRWATETNNEQVVFGTVIENIRVHPDYYVAVETAGGTQLFNFIVQNRQIAFEIIDYIKNRREGSTTITPLDDINHRQDPLPVLPNFHDSRVKLLTSVIECDNHIVPAVNQVFGRFLLVKDRDVGKEYKVHGFDCITLEGDMISRKGILRGGFLGDQKRMACQGEIYKVREEIRRIREEGREIGIELKEIEKKNETIEMNRRNNEIERNRLKLERNDLHEKMQKVDKNGTRNENRRMRLESQIKENEDQIELVKEDIQRIRREIASSTLEELTEEESKRLAELWPTIISLENEFEKKQKIAEDFVQKSQDKEFQLNEVLRQQIETLEKEIMNLNDGNRDDDDGIESMCDEELKMNQIRLSKDLSKLKAEMAETERHRSTLQASVATKKQKLNQSKEKEEKVNRKIEQLRNEIEAITIQLDEHCAKRDEVSGKEQPMAGSSELLNELSRHSSHELTKRLAIVAKELRNYDDLNRKASDQYTSFIDEETQLAAQRERLYKEEDSVLDLMKNLDDQKDDTLIKTFENVNSHFGKVFSEIVPGGKAKLVLKKMSDEEIALMRREANGTELALVNSERDRRAPASTSIDALTGVSVKIQFPTFRDYIPLESLSGGQKSVAALSLMFALQRVDSAPFYVLDEVDANLDIQYGGAVAQLIQRQSRSNQIIVISHKPQTISLSDRFLKTSIVNQTTAVTPTDQRDALLISQRMSIENEENNLDAH